MNLDDLQDVESEDWVRDFGVTAGELQLAMKVCLGHHQLLKAE